MNDYILVCIFLVGVLLLIISFRYNKKRLNVREIASFSMLDPKKTIEFTKSGKYSLVIKGGAIVNKFPVSIVSDMDSEKVDLYENVIKFRDIKNASVEVTYCYFTIAKPGIYSIIIKDYEKVSIKHYVPRILTSTINAEVPIERLSIAIKDYYSSSSYTLFIMPLIFGVLMLMLSISLILFNHGILEKKSSGPTTTIYTIG